MTKRKRASAAATTDETLEARHAAVGKSLAAIESKLKLLRERLAASHKHAAANPDHLPHTEAFLRDVGLKADEIIAWIDRSLPAK